MKYVGLYHLNAYTYADPTWFPDMDPELRAMFDKVTKGSLSGKAGETAEGRLQDQRPVRRHAGDASGRRRHSVLRRLRREGGDRVSRRRGQDPDKPFFINVNFMKVHQPNMPHRSSSTSRCRSRKYADSVVELDTRIGRIMDKLRDAGPRQEHAGLLHDRQRRLAGRLSRRRLHAVPRHQGHRARRRQPRSGHRRLAGQDQAGHARTTTSSAAST